MGLVQLNGSINEINQIIQLDQLMCDPTQMCMVFLTAI